MKRFELLAAAGGDDIRAFTSEQSNFIYIALFCQGSTTESALQMARAL